MLRVIGRIDRATEVHRALAAAGIGADLYTGPPAEVARGESEADILVFSEDASALATCRLLKKAGPRRPVLALVPERSAAAARAWCATSRGPDAWLVWPAPPESVSAALGRASEQAGASRPSIPPALVPSFLAAAASIPLLLVGIVLDFRVLGSNAPSSSAWRAAFPLGFALAGLGHVLRAPFEIYPRLTRFMGLALLVVGVIGALLAATS